MNIRGRYFGKLCIQLWKPIWNSAKFFLFLIQSKIKQLFNDVQKQHIFTTRNKSEIIKGEEN